MRQGILSVLLLLSAAPAFAVSLAVVAAYLQGPLSTGGPLSLPAFAALNDSACMPLYSKFLLWDAFEPLGSRDAEGFARDRFRRQWIHGVTEGETNSS